MEGEKASVSLQQVGARPSVLRSWGKQQYYSAFTTERYNEYPMQIKGYGAGAAVTAVVFGFD